MLTLLLSTDWVANREKILSMVAADVAQEKSNCVLMVPELISHDTERRLCEIAGDSASLYAEVITFTRLLRSISDYTRKGVAPCLDNGGRLAAMASTTRQLHSKLKAYASIETKPEFLTSLVSAIDEFKQCCVTSKDLLNAATSSEGSLAQKLEELSLILDTYDALCAQGKRDPADQMNWLLEQLESCDYVKSHSFYFDGFPDFTRQHLAIVEHILLNTENVVISLTCDRPSSINPAFENAGLTASHLLQFAKSNGIAVDIQYVDENVTAVSRVRQVLFNGSTAADASLAESLCVSQAQSVYQECVAAAARIRSLTANGSRYRDISIVCGDMTKYKNVLNMVFHRMDIPVYFAGTESILEKPVISALLCAIDAALGGFEQRDVLSYCKSVISPLDQQTCDELENYAIAWSIQGSMWLKEWTMHPDGLGKDWDENAKQLLDKLNREKMRAIAPLSALQQSFRNASDLSRQVMSIFRFMEDISLPETFTQLSEQLALNGDLRNSQMFMQLWEILLNALEQLYDILGTTIWDSDTFVRLLKLILSQYDVGTIPPVLDSVLVGSVSSMRCQQQKHLIVLGAEEGKLPSYPTTTGVLSEQERNELRKLGVSLQTGAMDGLRGEYSAIYDVFCSASDSISVSVSGGQPSYIFRRLSGLRGGATQIHNTMGTAAGNRRDAGALLVRHNMQQCAHTLSLDDEYNRLKTASKHQLGTVDDSTIRKLYGDCLYLSASKVDKQARCRLAYFLHYGLDAKERKPISVDPAEFGTYVHDVLEKTGRAVVGLGGFKKVSLDKTLELAHQFSDAYVHANFSQIDSARQNYLFRRNQQELFAVVEELWCEMQQSKFQPVDFEVSFGKGKQMKSIEIQGSVINARLIGYVDRVDAWNENGNNYFRVVDYKTGAKTLDFCDILNGIGLQMLLYLFALEENGKPVLGEHPIPAGVQYFPARVEVLPFQNVPTQEEIDKKRTSAWKRDGLLLADEEVIRAMLADDLKKIGIGFNKDGDPTGAVASREQLQKLKKYIYKTLRKIVDDISSGCVDPNPYFRGQNDNACQYCPFGDVCHPAEVTDRRDFAATSYDLFWQKIESEVKSNG